MNWVRKGSQRRELSLEGRRKSVFSETTLLTKLHEILSTLHCNWPDQPPPTQPVHDLDRPYYPPGTARRSRDLPLTVAAGGR